jgi:NTP pyrophosphatase (non-canonical NTP hydrolase)
MNIALVKEIAAELEADFPADAVGRQMRNALALAEEAGEAVGAVRRHLGLARRGGSLKEAMDELADVTICAYLIAYFFDADLDAAVAAKAAAMFARGFKETRTCPHCAADLRGKPIPDAQQESYGGLTHYHREIGVEIRGVYDGVLFYACPYCHGTWNRWSRDREPRLWAAAEQHRQRFTDEMTGKSE